MPKKRHHLHYSKPPSVAPASLRLSSSSQTNPHHELSVNERLANLRRLTLSPRDAQASSSLSAAATPSVPPTIHQILQLPHSPVPTPRRPQRRDINGRRLPPGPPPPQSWVVPSHSHRSIIPRLERDDEHIQYWPMPGVYAPAEGSLVDMVLRRIALDWDQQREWNRFYLYTLPSRLRSTLLSYVSESHGPGVSVTDLALVIVGPSEEELAPYELEPPDLNTFNSDMSFLDLTCSLGKSLTLKELHEFLFGTKRVSVPTEDVVLDSWDAPAPMAGPAKILPNLTHLSLAIDPGSTPSVSWKQLLSLADKLPQLTHLSLAGWPEPSLTPNAKFAKFTSATTGQSIQYSATGPYSHTLDGDWSEAIFILKRLSRLLYSLEYLDLTGCNDWAPALRENSDGELGVDLVDWTANWGKITTLRFNSGYKLADGSSKAQVLRFAHWIDEAVAIEKYIRTQRSGRGRWITVERDVLGETARAIVERERASQTPS